MVIVLGEALIDMLSGETTNGEKAFVPHSGGSPFNTCIAIARLGVPAGFLGRISKDFFGQMLINGLVENGVDLSFTQRGTEPTTLGFVKTSAGKDPEYAFYTTGTADCSLGSDELPESFPDSVKALMFGSISLLMEPGATVIESLIKQEYGKRILSFDPNIRPGLIKNEAEFRSRCNRLFALSSIVKISDVDLKWLYPGKSLDEASQSVKSFGPALVVVTRGAEGSFALKGDQKVSCMGTEVRVVDTVGAGDTFHAGLIAWLYKNELLNLEALDTISADQLTEGLSFASKCAAVTCSRKGADPPYEDEIL